MIELALEALRDAGIIEKDRRAQLTVAVGRSLNVQVYPEGTDDFYNVKLSRFDLEPEYCALTEVRKVIPEWVPVPMALRRMGEIHALITQGVPSKRAPEGRRSLSEFVCRYQSIQLQSPTFKPSTAIGHREAIASMLRSDALEELRPPLGAWLTSGASEFLDALPGIRQHGDFALTNLVATNAGYLILDWEDFGKVRLPGFDICVFLLDATGALDDGNDLSAVLTSTDSMISTVRGQLLGSLGLRADDFPHLLLASLTGFLFLKAALQYGTRIIESTKRLIAEMLERAGRS